MKIQIKCSNCRKKAVISDLVEESARLIENGWRSYKTNMYCPTCAKIWNFSNLDKPMLSEEDTFYLICDIVRTAKKGGAL